MNKSILVLTAVSITLMATIFGCNELSKNTGEIEGNIIDGNKNIDKTNREYLDDIEHYMKEKAMIIESNSQNIIAFKAKIDIEKEAERADYKYSIFELELQNSYMKKKLGDYKPDGKEHWELFKAEYTRQMDELDKEFKSFREQFKKHKNE